MLKCDSDNKYNAVNAPLLLKLCQEIFRQLTFAFVVLLIHSIY